MSFGDGSTEVDVGVVEVVADVELPNSGTVDVVLVEVGVAFDVVVVGTPNNGALVDGVTVDVDVDVDVKVGTPPTDDVGCKSESLVG
jgi:hypothetical protein